jgi:hypothetical protein
LEWLLLPPLLGKPNGNFPWSWLQASSELPQQQEYDQWFILQPITVTMRVCHKFMWTLY